MSLILDTSGVLAFVNRHDPDHEAVKSVILEEPGALIVPMGIMAEIGYMLEQRLGLRALEAFLNDLATGQFRLDCGLEDLPRVQALANRYSSLPLGFADAVVIGSRLIEEMESSTPDTAVDKVRALLTDIRRTMDS